jgi:hypothetical protein
VEKEDYFKEDDLNKELEQGTISEYTYVADGDTTFTYKMNSTGEEYNVSVSSSGKATIVENNIGNASTITADDYGKPVNYGKTYTGTGSGWEIFYADSSNVYLITTGVLTKDKLNISNYNGTSDFTIENLNIKFLAVKAGWFYKTYDPKDATNPLKYSGTYDYNGTVKSYGNMKATEYLLDNDIWGEYALDNYADWAIGGPTLEMLVASYNECQMTDANKITIADLSGCGYEKTISSGLINSTSYPWNHGTSYWLACPAGNSADYVLFIRWGNAYVDDYPYYLECSFRPVVCLNSSVVLTPNEDRTSFTID